MLAAQFSFGGLDLVSSHMIRVYVLLTFSIFFILPFNPDVQSQTSSPTPQESVVNTTAAVGSKSQDERLQGPVQDLRLPFAESCRTKEGRQLILDNEDQIVLADKKLQWEGLRANNQTTERTFDEYAVHL